MKLIKRNIEEGIRGRLFTGKAIVIMGARQVGKTTLLKQLFSEGNEDVYWMSGDDQDVRDLFENITATRLKAYFGHHRVIIIDEAQRISDVGIKLKLIVDQIPEVQLVATGSSSFELANRINEPLTGRKWEYRMFPLSFAELVANSSLLEEKRMLPHRLIYGSYPDVVTRPGDEVAVLRSLLDGYLYKDILEFDKIHKPEKLTKLLQAIAYQVGSEVSYNELAQTVGVDKLTIENYINLLEKCFIVFRLNSFSRNARNEIRKGKKIYFVDNGVRNAILSHFAPLELRNDIGMLWENLMVSERVKRNAYHRSYAQLYFWRTHDQKEIDLLEEKDGRLYAFEFKWNDKKKTSVPKSFTQSYPNSEFNVINRDNFWPFLS